MVNTKQQQQQKTSVACWSGWNVKEHSAWYWVQQRNVGFAVYCMMYYHIFQVLWSKASNSTWIQPTVSVVQHIARTTLYYLTLYYHHSVLIENFKKSYSIFRAGFLFHLSIQILKHPNTYNSPPFQCFHFAGIQFHLSIQFFLFFIATIAHLFQSKYHFHVITKVFNCI